MEEKHYEIQENSTFIVTLSITPCNFVLQNVLMGIIKHKTKSNKMEATGVANSRKSGGKILIFNNYGTKNPKMRPMW